ncbi:MAG: hypothetical protein DI535_02655 [Citrobacter freundii]|nr:MAG: hypothetical protein DI535_02655 [Citrobacter freundii]
MQQWIEGEHYYLNEEGLFVLTEKYHLARGYCCGNGCKHCPFDYENVPEPKRAELMEKRAQEKRGDADNNK